MKLKGKMKLLAIQSTQLGCAQYRLWATFRGCIQKTCLVTSKYSKAVIPNGRKCKS